MKKILVKTFGALAIVGFVGFGAQLSAQEKNVIEEVSLTGNNFKELRNLISTNFDYTNPNLAVGTTEAVVKFEVAENGEIKNVHADSKCKYAALEVEKVMKELIYQFKNERLHSKTYVMPVQIAIASR